MNQERPDFEPAARGRIHPPAFRAAGAHAGPCRDALPHPRVGDRGQGARGARGACLGGVGVRDGGRVVPVVQAHLPRAPQAAPAAVAASSRRCLLKPPLGHAPL